MQRSCFPLVFKHATPDFGTLTVTIRRSRTQEVSNECSNIALKTETTSNGEMQFEELPTVQQALQDIDDTMTRSKNQTPRNRFSMPLDKNVQEISCCNTTTCGPLPKVTILDDLDMSPTGHCSRSESMSCLPNIDNAIYPDQDWSQEREIDALRSSARAERERQNGLDLSDLTSTSTVTIL